ncbi:hypothetical protein K450DRAFT_169729 [Umbelopsis ramanniana AG]|uniref:Zn(2)-C6 fungal-type domain-containing protein n=1 Tax=Umbelopsis ramanniana AG TaxID=1314678 RepID=A0AAD5HHP9_UMBRA|nr:uncharacterized protein K450DRAFT_169729 [Umbelopsis ramanniana AG]KAI8583289.1 hypothetical protein K450DRAFT_169729 [Umbelopsis ramanniana AG]
MLPSSNYSYSQQQNQLQHLEDQKSRLNSSEDHQFHSDRDLEDSSSQQSSSSKKKKKATRACFHCQKAHLTCDDSRPCQRCIKRDLANTCTDGIRKRAKYLQDAEGSGLLDESQIFGFPLANYGFGSETANLEYSILSNMLQAPTDVLKPQTNNFAQPLMSRPLADDESSVTQPSSSVSTPITAALWPTTTVYANVKRPFSYAEGYHYLISFVKERMSREDLMRISRALALFRPSVLASMMNLTEDDLVFTEKSLQRTLLEYEKLISYSGTPTVVWRRTGEIALVGKEFSLLTQWSRDMLLDKKTYIYELMSNESAVEYWEKYATHAFDNTDSAVFSSCILLTPSGRPIAASMCFTIKRDIFDLPSVIVGNVRYLFLI